MVRRSLEAANAIIAGNNINLKTSATMIDLRPATSAAHRRVRDPKRDPIAVRLAGRRECASAAPTVAHFSAVCTEVNVVLSEEPTPATATMIAIDMPAAIRPYSIAVAPDFVATESKELRHDSSLTLALMN